MNTQRNESFPALRPGPLMVEENNRFYQWMIDNRSNIVDDGFIDVKSLEWEECSLRWKEIHSKIKQLEKEEEVLRNQLISLSDGSNSRGYGISVSQVTRKGTIDYSKIPELKNVDLEQYRKPETESWRVTWH